MALLQSVSVDPAAEQLGTDILDGVYMTTMSAPELIPRHSGRLSPMQTEY
jgi:hypothetical protein